MISPNVNALKISDNLKWDFQLGYQNSMQLFNYSGEITPELEKLAIGVVSQMTSITEEAQSLIDAANSFIPVNPTSK